MSFIIKGFGWKGAPLVAVASLLTLLALIEPYLEKTLGIFDTVSDLEGMTEAGETVLKVLGVGYLSGICSDVCRELGEPTVASAVSAVARLETLVLISPMLYEVLNLGLELAL